MCGCQHAQRHSACASWGVCMKVAYSRQRGPLRGAAVAKNVWLRLRVSVLFCGVLRTSCYEAKVLE